MVSDDLPNTDKICTPVCSSTMKDLEADLESGMEDTNLKLDPGAKDSTIFVAFKGNIKDKDFKLKLNIILESVPCLLNMESEKLKLQKVEPWNSVRVTFSIPREAAERLRILAQNNNQQLRDLGILSVQIEGEGAINLNLTQNRSQDVRMNGPMGGNNAVRLETGFSMQGTPGVIRMNNPAAVMMSQNGSITSSMMTSGINADLPPRAPRPASQPDAVEPLLSGIAVQQQGHPSGSLTSQLHPMQSVSTTRQMNIASFQQLQHQQPQLQPRQPQQHQQLPQGVRPSFATPTQVPVPPGWNQLSSGALQPPPAQGTMGTLTSNQGWKKTPLPGPMQQQQFQARPSLATVQTPSHPPPPYPFGSQQASQAHSSFPQMSNAGQFTAPQLKTLQGGPTRVPTPLQQPHLTSKSPASSPSFQQGSSPASSPTVNQPQQQMGPRPSQANALSQGFQQPVNSPGRNSVAQQGNMPPNFMVMQQQSQGPQTLHSSLGGIVKRLPPGFSAGQSNQNYMQGQMSSSAPGTPVNGGAPQLQTNHNVQHPGGQAGGPSQNQMHGPPSMMQTSLMGLHGNMNSQQAGGVPQVNMSNIQGQAQQGPQSQLMGIHQQIVSSQGQMVNIQAQGGLPSQSQLILSRGQLMPQGQMMVTSQNQNLGPTQQRMTPPKQLIPQQGQQMMTQHNQMIGPQGQVMLQQNPMIEQMMANQMQGNKQTFSAQTQSNVMAGQAQIMRGPTPNMQGNMVQFTGQMMAQQGTVNSSPQGMGIQGQVLRPAGPGPHLQQQHNDISTASNNDVNLTQMLPDVSMQHGNMVPSHLQTMQGNNAPGNHFSGHGLPFSTPFSGAPNGNQISCGQNPGFPVNKDVTLTSPLLVNLLQSDISTGHFGVNNKQNNQNATKPKKKKPPRKKKNQQVEEQLNAPDSRPAGLEETDQPPLLGEQGINLDSTSSKLSDFTSRPQGYPSQAVEQRPLQPIPTQLLQHGQQQTLCTQAQSQQQQQMMMMLMMQQQQQDPKSVRLPVSQSLHSQRGPLNPDTQRMPMQQSGNMSVMVSLQGPGSVPPSPDKQRMPLSVSTSLGNNGRKMVYQDNLQNSSSSPSGDGASLSSHTEGNAAEGPSVSGAPNNITPHLVISQNQLMMSGPKPGPSPQGASPQQQSANSLTGSHTHHFPNVGTPSQTSRPKTPNRASPRPYYPQTPNNRPPSTEPSEISLSPERLNASIAGLFPPQINIPLPPRPNLNRGFDQQGLNPTTLKAIGQAPSNLTINSPGFSASQTNKLDTVVVSSGKQPNSGGTKRASPSNSRRSSPGSNRKTAPSPGRQNSKAAKLALAAQQTSLLLQNMELRRNILVGSTPLQTPASGSFPNTSMGGHISSVSVAIMGSGHEDNKEGPSVAQDSEGQISQAAQGGVEQATIELKGIPGQEMKMLFSDDQQKKNTTKLPTIEEGKSLMSPAMREAPTSLSQLLDHSGAPNVTIKPPGLNLDAPRVVTPGEELKMMDPIPSLSDPSSGKELPNSLNLPSHSTETCATQVRQELGELNPTLSQNVPAVIQRPVSSSSITTTPLPPNQITVFVTSNPITSSANTSAPLPSHLQPTLVSTVVSMPNVGNKVMVSEGQSAVQSSPRPQFITPVFINSSSIIQVMKGSQSSTLPTAPVTSNPNIMPQSVAVVGSLQIPQNIKFSSGPSPSSTSSSNISSIPTSRPLVINSLAAPIQPPPCPSVASVTASPHPHLQQTKDFTSDEVNFQANNVLAGECSSVISQSTPLSSPPHSSSPGSSSNRQSPASSAKGKGKLDKIGQILLTKACKKVTNSPEKGEDQYAFDSEAEGQMLETSTPENLGTGQVSLEADNKSSSTLAPSLSKLGNFGAVLLSDSTPSAAATAAASVSTSVSSNIPLLNVLSAASPVNSNMLPITPNITSNHSGPAAEQSNITSAEDKMGTYPEQLQNQGVVPENWRVANVMPIFNKGSRGDPGNYTPVNLTSVSSKMVETIIKNEITDHIHRHGLMEQSQHGFSQGKSCLTNLLHFFEGMNKHVDKASSQNVKQMEVLSPQQGAAVERPELDMNNTFSSGPCSEMKEAPEKSKPPSRRNSRTEESAVPQEMAKNGQRKRSSRPSSASSTAKEMGASPTQSKRRKSK